MVEIKSDSCWMMSTTSGIMSVPIGEVPARKGQGWTECDSAGKSLSAPAPKSVKKKKE